MSSLNCAQQAEMMINLNRDNVFRSIQPQGKFELLIFQITQRPWLFVPLFTLLSVSFLPWLNLIHDLVLSSLSLIFLWISAVPPNPSVPLSRLFFQFHLLLTGGWGVCWLVFAGCLCFLCLVSIQYQLLSLVMEECLIHLCIYLKAGKHTYLHTDTDKNTHRHPNINWPYYE